MPSTAEEGYAVANWKEQRGSMPSDTSNRLALEVEGVSHAFGARPALDAVGFAIKPSRFCVLLGLNGAGTVSYTHLTLPTKA